MKAPWSLFRFSVLLSIIFLMPFLASTQSIKNTSSSGIDLLSTANTWALDQTFTGNVRPTVSDGGPSVGNHDAYWRYGYISRSLTFGLVDTITDNTPTKIFEVAVNALNSVGGIIVYNVSTDNGTDEHNRAGLIPFTMVQKSSTNTCNLGTASDSFSRTDGSSSLTLTWGNSAGDPNQCRISLIADSSFDVSSKVEAFIIGSIDNDSLGISVIP